MRNAKVKDFMTSEAVLVTSNATPKDAATKMRTHKVNHLIMRNNNGTVKDILSFGGLLRKQADADEIANIVKHTVGTKAV